MPGGLRTTLAAAMAVAALVVHPVGAAITEVELSLSSVRAVPGNGVVLLRFEGGLLGDALVQIDYPLHLVVWERDTGSYVRFDVAVGAFAGSAPQLVDGLSAAEGLALLAEGTVLPGTKVAYVGEGRIDVLLPAGVLNGPLDAVAFALYEGEALVSNVAPVEGS